jgi:tRNA dimethylallyltransferase
MLLSLLFMRMHHAPQQVQLVYDIQRASRNLCHRQLSWFRDEPLFTWLDADREPEEITADILAQLRGTAPTGGVCTENGRLTKEQEREMKTYVARLSMFDKEDVLQSTLGRVMQQCA